MKDDAVVPSTDVKPPTAEKQDFVMTLHGDTRIDPYFWMRLTDEQKQAETPDHQTKKLLAYLNKENEYTSKVLKHTEGFQQQLYDEIVGRIKEVDESVPYLQKGYWYYRRYEEGKEYPIHVRKKEHLDAKEEIFLNVNDLAEGHAYYAAEDINVGPSNTIIAFSEDTLSRRVYTLKFKNLKNGKYLADQIPNTSRGGAWSNDGLYYFYATQNATSLLPEKIWRHKLGTEVSEDVIVYKEKDPSYFIGVYKSKSDKFITIYNTSTLVSDYHILDANNPTGKFKQFIPRAEKHEYSIYHFENKFYILTNWNAQNFRLMETLDDATEQENWTEVIAHREDVLLEDIVLFQNHMVVDERKLGLTHLRIINQKTGDEHYIKFDESAYTAYPTTNVAFNTEVLRFGYQSMTTPGSVYDYNMNSKGRELKKQTEVVGGYNSDDYYTERIWATARDGVHVPISVVYKKGFEKNGKKAFLLSAYGSYGYTYDARFSSARLSLLDRGFGFAVAHVRGGQMLGRQWYEDGKMFKKKNTFNDFVDCAKHLIAKNYTSPEQLYAEGGSAGGLLMGTIYNMNPELFNGVLADVPFVDVVSTMLDETIPLTTNEFKEWGNPQDKASYEYMLSYSPYDQVESQEYTNMLVTTGLFDSQVQYWEPTKWVAKLRDMKTDNNILIMHCDMESGHGGISGRFKQYRITALQYAFLLDLEGIQQ